MALGGDTTALRICMDRIAPLPRAESAPVLIPGLAEAVTLTDKAQAISAAIGKAEISPDTGSMLLQAMAAACKVVEFDELQRRVAHLEAGSLL